MGPKTKTTKIISIADQCTLGCQLHVLAERLGVGLADPHFLAGNLRGQEQRYKQALERILKACASARGEGNHRLITIVKETAREALQ